MFWKKKKQPQHSDEEKRIILDEVQVTRFSEIFTDSVKLMKTTKNPKTLFGRYDTALSSVEQMLSLTHNEEARRHAQSMIDVLKSSRDEIVKDFVDRCYQSGNLYTIKDELFSGQYSLSPANTAYIHFLLKKMETEDDNAPVSGEYIYCSLSFDAGGKSYYYKTTDETLKCGDEVIVPVGNSGKEGIAKIEKIERFRAGNTPYPPSRTKNIIRKSQ